MTDDKKARKPVTQLNEKEPIWLALDQTPHKTYVEPFNGLDAEDRAKEYAKARAAKVNRTVLIFGPQEAKAVPPVPAKVGVLAPCNIKLLLEAETAPGESA